MSGAVSDRRTSEFDVLRILSGSKPVGETELQTAMSKRIPPRWFPAFLLSMEKAGLIVRGDSKIGKVWHVTDVGRAKLPGSQQPAFLANWRPLQRQASVRRAGSNAFRSLPSMAAGRERAWRHPV